MKKVFLKEGKESAVRRFHPWVFSGAILKKEDGISLGEIVEIVNFKGTTLAVGSFEGNSIAVKLWDFVTYGESAPIINQEWWNRKLESAFDLRKDTGFIPNDNIDRGFRLLFSEGDTLSGVVIDVFGGNVVIQMHSLGILENLESVKNAILNLESSRGFKIISIYNKSEKTLPENNKNSDGVIYGTLPEKIIITEGESKMFIDLIEGQKTGFFLDQKDSRGLLKSLSKGKSVLNTFCYTGGFSLAALYGGAKLVHSVDSSKGAIEILDRNIELNGFLGDKHQSFVSQTSAFLKSDSSANGYDIVILDPPAFAKNHNAVKKALKGYISLNKEGLEKVNKGGLMLTFSCSGVVTKEQFQSSVFSAAIEANRKVVILGSFNAPMDHPISIFHPEGEYLKGLLVRVD